MNTTVLATNPRAATNLRILRFLSITGIVATLVGALSALSLITITIASHGPLTLGKAAEMTTLTVILTLLCAVVCVKGVDVRRDLTNTQRDLQAGQ